MMSALVRSVGRFLALAAMFLGLAACESSQHYQFMRDEQGRALILHGLNVSSSAKDHPQRMPWITRNDAQRMARDWGFNVVRFLIFWDALEPNPWEFDDAYLDLVAERIDWFAEAGIYVILDMHQDVWGKRDASGQTLGFDGAPPWAGRTDGIPHTMVEPWAFNYLEPAVRRAFDNFWNDEGPHADLQEHYAATWARVAQRFKDHPMVLGYNLMNEPYAGNAVYADFNGVGIGNLGRSIEFQRTKFVRFHERMFASIRAVDADSWIFFEPLAIPTNDGGASYLPVLTDPRDEESRLAYLPHHYSLQAESGYSYEPEHDAVIERWARERRRESGEQRAPMLVGEFGVLAEAGGDPLRYLERFVNLADRMTSGWTYWSYDKGGGFSVVAHDGSENPQLNVLVRAYPQKVAGTPIAYGYNPAARIMYLEFVDRPGVSGATEIYVPAARFYPDGWQLHVSDSPGMWSSQWDAEREVLSLSTPRTGHRHYVLVTPPTACGSIYEDGCGWIR